MILHGACTLDYRSNYLPRYPRKDLSGPISLPISVGNLCLTFGAEKILNRRLYESSEKLGVQKIRNSQRSVLFQVTNGDIACTFYLYYIFSTISFVDFLD